MKKYMIFDEVIVPGLKTKTVNIYNRSFLGSIEWYGPWRQYCFSPRSGTVFNKGCLEDINAYIKQLMDERKLEKVSSER